MLRSRPALLLACPALLAALALTGCDDGAARASSDSSSDASSDAGSTPSAVPSVPTLPSTPTAPDADADFPVAVDVPVQGGRYGVVVLSDGAPADLAASQEAVAAYGFEAYTAEIGCLDGAGTALAIPDGTIVSYLVFADVDAAQDFHALYTYLDEDAVVPGAAEARTYCLDG